jgi:hypothetical protein
VDEFVQPGVADFLAQSETAKDEEGIHRGSIGEAVIGEHGEPGLCLHRA